MNMRTVALVGMAGMCGLLTVSQVQAEMVVVAPGPSFATDPVNLQGPTPFRRKPVGNNVSTGSRNQVLYSGSFFNGPVEINSVAFRPSSFTSDLDISNVSFRLSTTTRSDMVVETPLSTNFDDNLGADLIEVYNNSLSFRTGTANAPFDYLVPFTTPFQFDPTLGNLLLDVIIPNGTLISDPNGSFFNFFAIAQVDSVNPDGISSVVNIDNEGATGTLSSAGPGAQFNVTPVAAPVPEPTSGLLFGLGATGLAFYQHRRRRA